MKKAILPLIVLTTLLASCSQQSTIPQNEGEAISSSNTPNQQTIVNKNESPKVTYAILNSDGTETEVSELPVASDITSDKLTPQAKGTPRPTAVYGYSFTKREVKPLVLRKIGPQTFSLTATGEYNLTISGEGSIKLVKVTGGGSIKVTAGMTYTNSWNTCRYYETTIVTTYIRYYIYNVYPDGTRINTGAYTDTPQGSVPNTVGKGNWTLC